MKKTLVLWVFCASFAVAAISLIGCSGAGGDNTKVYNIGDTGPAGGIIFYDKGNSSDGWRYLEAAPSDQTTAAAWGNQTTTGITNTAIGTGKANTDAIVSFYGAGSYAASVCKNLNLNGYHDWFLPSKDELAPMLKNLAENGIGGFAYGYLYWTSSEANQYNAWGITMYSGSLSSYKTNACHVRAIREF